MARPPDLLHATLDRCRAAGARGAELCLRTEAGRVIRWVRGRLESEPSACGELRVRVWVGDGQVGEAVGEAEAMDALVQRAMNAAELAAPDPFGGPVTGLGVPARGLGVDDQRLATITDEDRLEVLTTVERAVRMADRRLMLSDLMYTESRSDRWYASTRALVLNEGRTTFSLRGAVHQDDAPPLALHDEVVATSFATIATVPFGTNLGRRAAGILKRGPDPVASPRVLLPPPAVAALFARIADQFDADNLESRRGWIGRAFRERAFDPRIHVLDDAGIPGALRTTAFDDRGVPPVPVTLIREGLVDQGFVSPELARARGTRPTGHWTLGRNRPSNVLIRPGNKSVNVALNEQRDLVWWVDAFDDLAGLDLEAGTLTWTTSGRVFRGQQVEGGFRDLRLRADLHALLGRVVEVTSDSDRIGHVDAPSLIVDGFHSTT